MTWSPELTKRRVVITGLGVVAPNGIGIDAFWRNCLAGKSGVTRITEFDVNGFDAQIAGVVENFDPMRAGIASAQSERLDRYALFALAAAQEAVSRADLNVDPSNSERVGVCIATAIAGTKFMEEEFLRLTHGGAEPIDPAAASDWLFYGASFHMAASEVARALDVHGPVQTLATGCTAGLDALGQAFDLIRSGEADVMIAGATEAPLTPIAMAAFDIIGALASDRNDRPTEASRPYDASRAGFVLGEGCGMFVLESLDHAIARGATVLAEVKGFGSTCNAFHMTDLAPDGIDLHRAMVLALADARLDAVDVGHVNAHGSSTQQNDINETNAVKRTLGNHAYGIPICSLKSIIGHALAAANAIEAVAATLTLVHRRVPPTINYENRDPACDLDYVVEGEREVEIDCLLKDASGFSGIHSALVLGRVNGNEPRSMQR
ncbi:Actinorhodin polyketide putative beta-ketoacyl synthase 1 [Paraburkholderia caffeinitolerans]|uniref:Actinorhodin polyketide putative beta-ketoacyl synthase 1 n=1 Tax=Paraburkholderia caffeinitolerans TaxID=1723730 RepID=A0A6J5GH48_9BURK|nr:beta-ketoacyl-[acyl-carrier-protein] synthase family protein [Paraburkholderia caffeinitolerans]CAB3800771.1 Actinorhodin polyketide putative beta-ketoacyl synthase 1 [Paraburkholderia caffeinitolerans]